MTTTPIIRPKLTAKQQKFCLYYFQEINATQAAIKAGYSSHTAQQSASENLSKPLILERIAELSQKAEDAAIGTVVERKKRLTDIYRANLTDFLDEKGQVKLSKDIPHHGAVSEYSVKTIGEGEDGMVLHKTLKLRDPVAAIQEQNKMERIGAQDTAQGNTTNIFNIAVVTTEADGMLKRLLAGERTDKELPGG